MNETAPAILRELPAELIGDRVVLRPYHAGVGAALWDAIEESREHILPWLPWGDKHKSAADSEAFVRRMEAQWLLREDLGMGIWEQSSGRLLGGTGLHRINWDVPSFEIGYWLRRTAVGNGFMTESTWLLCRLAFDTLSANRVFIRCGAENHRSAAVAQRLGFTLEGSMRNSQRDTKGELYDMLMFSMMPGEYLQRRAEVSSGSHIRNSGCELNYRQSKDGTDQDE